MSPERPSPEEPAAVAANVEKADQNLRLMREYGKKYIEIQIMILAGMSSEQERLDWADRYGASFHELATSDSSFHDLVMAAEPNIEEIKKRVEEAQT
ncbi:MAG: hypothetical protein WCT10_00090 [Patescibacteria group bacterium]|jgi:hypothetical protein